MQTAHGTFIGHIRLEPNKPQQLFFDTEFKFGASTRSFILREKPQTNINFPSILNNIANSNNTNNSNNDKNHKEDKNAHYISASNLPESEAELEVNLKQKYKNQKKITFNSLIIL
jgi:hypothetical protein